MRLTLLLSLSPFPIRSNALSMYLLLLWQPRMQMTSENRVIGIYVLFKYFARAIHCNNGWIGYRRDCGIPYVLRQDI